MSDREMLRNNKGMPRFLYKIIKNSNCHEKEVLDQSLSCSKAQLMKMRVLATGIQGMKENSEI